MENIISKILPDYNSIKKDPEFIDYFCRYIWQFRGNSSWIDMPLIPSYYLEKCIFSGNFSVITKINGFQYQFDLDKKIQLNTLTNKIRQIRRTPIFLRYREIPLKTGPIESSEELLKKYWIKSTTPKKDLICNLCLDTFNSDKEFGSFKTCHGHYFHLKCSKTISIQTYFAQTKQCPVCRKTFGPITGNCPTGKMKIKMIPESAPGFESYKIWKIKFIFREGIQGEGHPNPGTFYGGEVRYAFLPDTEEGRNVLGLFIKGWESRVLFTIGRSLSRMVDNVIIYNGIHMKSTIYGGPHGFPDKGYLMRVAQEFSQKHIF